MKKTATSTKKTMTSGVRGLVGTEFQNAEPQAVLLDGTGGKVLASFGAFSGPNRAERLDLAQKVAQLLGEEKGSKPDVEAPKLRVWWIPQVPMKPFYTPVRSLREAKLLLDTLAAYDTYQFENKVKPDFSNAGGLEVFEDGEWVDWDDFDTYSAENAL